MTKNLIQRYNNILPCKAVAGVKYIEKYKFGTGEQSFRFFLSCFVYMPIFA